MSGSPNVHKFKFQGCKFSLKNSERLCTGLGNLATLEIANYSCDMHSFQVYQLNIKHLLGALAKSNTIKTLAIIYYILGDNILGEELNKFLVAAKSMQSL